VADSVYIMYIRAGNSKGGSSGPDCDVGQPSDRVNCGIIHMRPYQCILRGCCWDSSVLGVPWCFYGKDIVTVQSNICINLFNIRDVARICN